MNFVFKKGYLETKDYYTALNFGIAAGSATAFSKNLAKSEETLEIFDELKK